MYEISGFEPITRRVLKRYLDDTSQDGFIKELVHAKKRPLHHLLVEASRLRDEMLMKMEGATADQRVEIIRNGFASKDPRVQVESAHLIEDAQEESRAILVREGLSSANPDVRAASAWQIRDVPS